MRLVWLRVRFAARAALGIRDMRQGTLRQRIRELEDDREAARVRWRLLCQLAGWSVLVAALAVVAWVAMTGS